MAGIPVAPIDDIGGCTVRRLNGSRLFVFSFILSLAVWTVPGVFSAEPVLRAPDYADQGGVIQAVILGVKVDKVSVSIIDDRGGAVSRSEGFTWRSPGGEEVLTALLAVPSNLTPGRYRLTAFAEEGRAQWQLEKSLNVRSRDFPERVIVLSDKMTTIYTDTSERKSNEARALWAVLNAFDSKAVHHTGPLRVPFDDAVITSEFGVRRRYRMPDGSETQSIHFGRDLWAEKGTPVAASGRGRVALAADRLLTGKTVILEHLPGVYSLYYHLDSISVALGEMVPAGTMIGTLGDTGFATGAHLHWELRVSGVPAAPEVFLDRPLLDTDDLIGKIENHSP